MFEINNWSLVSPSKVGGSPTRFTQKSQTEDFQISGSKFSVLSIDEEVEGEIMEDRLQTTAVGVLEIHSNSDKSNEEDGVYDTTTSQAEAKAEEAHKKGAKHNIAKEKKAKSQDANLLAMSTRSSRRHL